MTSFVELNLSLHPDFAEILVAELAEIGFDSFVDTDEGIQAYITEELRDESALQELLDRYRALAQLVASWEKIEKQNWNEAWEKSFSPIQVDHTILVRATFHEPDPSFPLEIIITPKMSFGTGHHETTSQVMSLQLGIDHQGKSVLDVGTGTGILAILAAKLGATRIHGFDIDEWSVENTLENIDLNQTPFISVSQGTIADQEVFPYDIVLANINRNILLAEIPQYVSCMAPEGHLFVSGFYTQDAPDIEAVAIENGLKKIAEKSKNGWAAIVFQRG